MTFQRFLLGAASVVTALLLQLAVISRLPLPGAAPDLLLVLVVAFALAEGPMSGMVTGYVAGMLADALSVHEIGRLALAYAVAGYVTGMLQDDTERSTLLPFGAVLLGAMASLGAFSLEGILLADKHINLYAVVRSAISSVPYDVVLTPFVVPVVSGLVRRLDVDPLRRL
ncbi:MAG: rod shape-determining protein MreD [Frankiales bacterium]|nr:rod shape-determining protein MreD [Frankiales bacterium]